MIGNHPIDFQPKKTGCLEFQAGLEYITFVWKIHSKSKEKLIETRLLSPQVANYLMSIMARGVYDRRGFLARLGNPTLALLGRLFVIFLEGWSFFFFFLGGGGGLLKTFGLLSAFVFSWNVTRGWEPEYIGDMEPHISGVFQRIRKATNIRNEVFFFFSLRSPKPKQSLNFKGLLDDPFLRILFLNHWAKYGVCLILSPLLKQATFSWQTLSFKRLRSSLFTEFMVFFLGWTC